MQIKKVLAVVMSLCIVGGTLGCGAPAVTQTITAQAAEASDTCYSFDASTGVLTLEGKVDRYEIAYFSSKTEVKKIIAKEGTVLPANCSRLFAWYTRCTSIDLSGADTSSVTDMSYMFSVCHGLTKLDLSSFDTGSVTDMQGMFQSCIGLKSLDVSRFDTSSVTDMSYMFNVCYSLTSLDLSGFDTSNVTDMRSMFEDCRQLTSLDVSRFDTGNVTDMKSMFGVCRQLPSLDVSGFDTHNVTDMSYMFNTCTRLTAIDVSGFDTSKVTDMMNMFLACYTASLDVSGFDKSIGTNLLHRLVVDFVCFGFHVLVGDEHRHHLLVAVHGELLLVGRKRVVFGIKGSKDLQFVVDEQVDILFHALLVDDTFRIVLVERVFKL